MTDDDLSHVLEQMSGNPATARAIRTALERLKTGAAGKDLAEMARDILDGRLHPRETGRSDAYSIPLLDAVTQFHQWQDDLTEDERQEHLREARRQLGLGDDPAV
jgi:hypothetical protein